MADSDDGKNRCELCGASNADKVVINIPGTRQTTRRWVCQDHSEHPDWSAESGERNPHSATINVGNLGFMIQSVSFGMLLGGYFRWPSLLFEFAFALMVVGTILFWYDE